MSDQSPLSRVARGLGVAMTALAVLAASVARPHAQPRPPIAIVGARIVDGSGNEPFTGTIVISGGRITAVGRQVETPPDAQTIDGAGKAVLPGFIDTGLRSPADRSTDAGRRALGRVLASGVTTAAVEGDAGSAPAGDPSQPRLVAMPTPDAASAPAASGAPAGGRPLRSGTIAVALGDGATAAVTAIKAAKARLALSGLAAEDGTIDAARLAASGLTPLDAVTAMTGGGAWALGLQSDRGLLAPGMRADLVVVAGDPSVSLDALTHVEHVFLGGVDVDRATLRRPEPATPAPVPSSAAASPTTAPPAVAVTPAPATPAPSRSRTRGSKGSKAAPAAVPSATAVTDTPPATVAGVTPAPRTDTATTATPESAKPEAAAPPALATARTTATTVPAAARLRDALLDDFERGETVSAVGPAWVGSGSGEGSAATTLIMGRVIKGLRDHALLVSARMGSGRDAFARAALKLDADDRPVDISRFRGLRFDARGEGRYRIVFVTRSVADGRYHESYFSGSPLWTPVSMPFASIGQNGAGDRVPWSGRDVIEVRFEMVRDAGHLGWLELDNVTFY
ncbi:MAG: amidohydrolase family protein [Vicinamibacteraceae bacterium]